MKTLALVVLLGCGASAREKTISATYAAAEAADVQLVAYEHDAEAGIVATAASLEQGSAALAASRARTDKVEHALDALWRAIAAAALIDDSRSLSTMLQAAVLLSDELHALGVTK